MGMFKKKVRVSNPKNDNDFFESDFWVDTGALYSFIPEDYLEKIGFEPETTKNLVYADGRIDRRLFGYCRFEIEELAEKAICPVIAGIKGSLFLLGATALENFGVEADPVNKKLNPIHAIIGGFIGSYQEK